MVHRIPVRGIVSVVSLGILLSCSGEPNSEVPAPRGEVPLTSLHMCTLARSPEQLTSVAFVRNPSMGCGSTINVHLGTYPTSFTQFQINAMNSAISTAVQTWNGSLPPGYDLPHLGVGSGGIAVNVLSSSSTTNCGDTPPGTSTIRIQSSPCNGNYVPFSHMSDLVTHELGHAIGFDGATWHASQAEAVAGNCAMHLPPSDRSIINSTVCLLEQETLFWVYSVRTDPLNIQEYIVTGLSYQPASINLNSGGSAQASVTGLQVPCVGGGGPPSPPRTMSACDLPASDGSYQWSSNNSNITVNATGNPVTITAGSGSAGATVTITPSSVGTHNLGSSFSPAMLAVTVTPSNTIVINAGNGQTAVAGTAVAVKPSVKVLNGSGQPVANSPVTFVVASGGGSVTGGAQTTNASGIATVGNWTLGGVAGNNSLSATSSSVPGGSVTFTATGTVGTIAVYAGNGQSATVGTAVAVAPAVRILNAASQPVPNIPVTFQVVSGGGSITGPTISTNSSGIATVGSWTLGPVAGVNSLSASASLTTGSPVTFTATGTSAGGLAAPTNFHATACSTYVAGGKTYVNYTLAWTPGVGNPSGTLYEIGDALTANSSQAVVHTSGTNASSVVLNYTILPNSPTTYFWVRHNVAGGGSPTTWAALAENPIHISQGCDNLF